MPLRMLGVSATTTTTQPSTDVPAEVAAAMTAHIQSDNPHPTYDDVCDLTVLCENAMV